MDSDPALLYCDRPTSHLWISPFKPKMTVIRAAIISLVLLTINHNGMAAESVSSPGGEIVFSLSKNEQARLVYSITFGTEAVVAQSRLGLRFREQRGFDSGFDIKGVVRRSVDSTWEQPWGERRRVRNHYNELMVQLADSGQRQFNLRIRVFDDGVGFRYEVPAQPGFDSIDIVDELTEFHLPKDSTAWWIPGRAYNRYEYLYRETGLEDIETAHTPMTLRTPGGTHLSIHEAALVDYAGFVLDQRRENVFQTNLTPWSDGIRVKTRRAVQDPLAYHPGGKKRRRSAQFQPDPEPQ